MNSEELEAVDKSRYLGVKFMKECGGKAMTESKDWQGRKIGGALKALVNGKKLTL